MPNYDQPNQNVAALRMGLPALPDELWPNRRSLSCIVASHRIRCNNLGQVLLKDSTPMIGGESKFKDWELRDQSLDEIHGEWLFGAVKKGAEPGEDDIIIWNPPLSAADMLVPVKQDTVTTSVYWHPVVRDANIVIKPRTIFVDTTEQFPVVRKLYHPGYEFSTTIKRRIYVSNNPWPEHKLRSNPPLPTPIPLDWKGIDLEIDSCLHPEIEVDSDDDSNTVVLDLTPSVTGLKATGRRTVPATNHTGWQDYILHIDPIERDGVFYRVVHEAIAPDEPAFIVQ